MEKYPRTFHLSFSPEIHSDDKVCNMEYVNELIDNEIEIVISEKADGGNCALKPTGVFARSHSQETSCATFNYIKNVHYYPNMMDIIDSNLNVFGENLFAIHSIEYTALKDYFYVFNILDKNSNEYLSFDNVLKWSEAHKMKTVPVVYIGKIESIEWLENFLSNELKNPSDLGGEREGFVIRIKSSFHEDDFQKSVFKYVRRGHVQTEKHWSKNWVQAKLKVKK